jgi:hypothetical protein
MPNNAKKKDINFIPTKFNTNFISKDIPNKSFVSDNSIDYNYNDNYIPPHKEPIEIIIINIRGLFFQILNLIEEKVNPIPFIFSTDKRQFTFALFLIIFGTLLLLLSSLMVS